MHGQAKKEAMLFLSGPILAAPAGEETAAGVPETGMPEEAPSGDSEGVAGEEPGLLDGAPAAAALGLGEGGAAGDRSSAQWRGE